MVKVEERMLVDVDFVDDQRHIPREK